MNKYRKYQFELAERKRREMIYRRSVHGARPVRYSKVLAVTGYIILVALTVFAVLEAIGGN